MLTYSTSLAANSRLAAVFFDQIRPTQSYVNLIQLPPSASSPQKILLHKKKPPGGFFFFPPCTPQKSGPFPGSAFPLFYQVYATRGLSFPCPRLSILSIYLMAFPAPSTTQFSGLSKVTTGILVFFESRVENPYRLAEPPVR